jgi:hypothetical protein
MVSARLREQGRNGPAASKWPFVQAHPQSLRCFDLLLQQDFTFPDDHIRF